eukprot:10421579-Prorocentrum_lima.AAC.1
MGYAAAYLTTGQQLQQVWKYDNRAHGGAPCALDVGGAKNRMGCTGKLQNAGTQCAAWHGGPAATLD